MNLERYISFKQGQNKHLGKAPHKPILVLALIDAMDKGLIRNNQFPISPDLVSLFRGMWSRFVKTAHTPNFALPFFHLKNEKSKVWSLHTLKGFENVLTASGSVKSLSSLNEYVLYGQLAGEFYQFLQMKVNRELAKARIIERYFPDAKGEKFKASYDYLGEIEHQILNDDPVEYRKRIQKLENEPKEFWRKRCSYEKVLSKDRSHCFTTTPAPSAG